ncbi:MAG: hypothetical protein JWM36_3047 [Hyphomicrobiales bacterium]|nr:hypothetical protein [Hyphomicrobiales bacterium]
MGALALDTYMVCYGLRTRPRRVSRRGVVRIFRVLRAGRLLARLSLARSRDAPDRAITVAPVPRQHLCPRYKVVI